MRFGPSLVFVLATLAGAKIVADDGPYVLKTRDSKTIVATLTSKIQAPKLRATRWIGFVARPPDLPAQIVREAAFSPDGRSASETSDSHQPILVADVAVGNDALKAAIEFRAQFTLTLQSRKLERLAAGQTAPPIEPPTAELRARCLAATEVCDFRSPAVQAWLQAHELLRRPGEGDVDLGRRIFLALKKTFQYEYAATLNRKASNVCRVGRSDCGGLSTLFVAALRSNGIPARERVGRWGMSEHPGEKVGEIPYHQEHAKPEFFADGVGWIPVDPALAVLYDKSAEGLDFFANDNGDFVTFHTGGDLVIDSRMYGRQRFESLQGIVFWVNGGGSLDDMTVEEHWTVRPFTPQSP